MFDTVPSKRGRLSGKEKRSAELVPRLRPLLKTLIPHPAPVDGAGFGLPHHSDLYGLWGRRQPYRWGARHLAGNQPNPLPASALDGHLLGTVTHQTMPVHMLMSGNHHDTVQFHILRSPNPPLLLGYPWLHRHSLHIDWKTGSILGWSPCGPKSAFGKSLRPCHLLAPVLSPTPCREEGWVPEAMHRLQGALTTSQSRTATDSHWSLRPSNCCRGLRSSPS